MVSMSRTSPQLRECHRQGENLDTLMKRVAKGIELCLEDGDSADPLELAGVQRMAL
jgi:hypothetical protein